MSQAAKTPDDVRSAVSRLEKGLRYFKDNDKFELALGGLYIENKDIAKAQTVIKAVLAREPGSMSAHLDDGRLLFKGQKASSG